ncbi:GNAT family N-acetyltransferase [Solitalea longa]|uniref:GNAT family N-acetyltransferase n=1 Tax=Solitalea longa TaxID=2079460 RepID=UPI001FAF0160|nr:hypothetical protein [Solitalea longa]
MNSIYQFPPLLENERVKLEPLELKHVEELLPIALNPDLWQLSSQNFRSKEELEAYINAVIVERATKKAFLLLFMISNQGNMPGAHALAKWL